MLTLWAVQVIAAFVSVIEDEFVFEEEDDVDHYYEHTTLIILNIFESMKFFRVCKHFRCWIPDAAIIIIIAIIIGTYQFNSKTTSSIPAMKRRRLEHRSGVAMAFDKRSCMSSQVLSFVWSFFFTFIKRRESWWS